MIPFSLTDPADLSALDEAYALPAGAGSGTRPFAWLTYVMSADGLMSLQEPSHPDPAIGLSGPGIALRHLDAPGAALDAAVLQYGWATADAIVVGSGTLRAEPALTWIPWDEPFRQRLRARARRPLRVILSVRGLSAETLCLPVFQPSQDFEVLVATTAPGAAAMAGAPVPVRAFGGATFDFPALFAHLQKRGVRTIDLQGGARVAGMALEADVVDEYRLTLSPVIVGNRDGSGARRPGPVRASFSAAQLRPLRLGSIATCGAHLFLRYWRTAHHGLVNSRGT